MLVVPTSYNIWGLLENRVQLVGSTESMY
jgi:hypothetical protein